MSESRRDRDAQLALGFFVLGLLTRLPFQSQILYHWDSVNFALALDEFDVAKHQPQPPGYVLYILLGKAFNVLFNDPNTSLVWISVVFSALTVAAIFWAGRSMFGREVGLVSAGLALTSPLLWFHGEVALSYIIEAFFVTVIAFCAYRLLAGDHRYVMPLSLALGIAGGFRQNTLVLLLPLWLFTLHRLTWRRRIAAAVALTAAVGVWLAPMLYLSGGVSSYLTLIGSYSQYSLGQSAAESLWILATNVLRLTVYGFYALTLGLPLLLAGLACTVRDWREWVKAPAWQVLAVWLFPSLVFYVFFVLQAGYVFTFMPAVLLILGFILVRVIPRVTAQWKHARQWSNGLLALVMVGNVALFLFAPPFLFGQKRMLLNTPSWSSIYTRSDIVNEKLTYIRDHFSPEYTAILTNGFDFRYPYYYLPEYQRPSLSQEIRLDSREVTPGDDVRLLVLFNEDIDVLDANSQTVQAQLLNCGESLRWLERAENQEFIISPSGVGVKDEVGTRHAVSLLRAANGLSAMIITRVRAE